MFSIPNLAPILPFNKANPDFQIPVWDPCPFNAFSSDSLAYDQRGMKVKNTY